MNGTGTGLRRTRQTASVVQIWLCCALTLQLVMPGPEARAQPRPETSTTSQTGSPATALEQLVEQAVQRITERHARPLGQVVERRRGRVFVAVQGEPPEDGMRLAVYRGIEGLGEGRERLITFLQVQRTTAGLLECREVDRVDRQHAEAGDVVRLQGHKLRVLLAPCLALVDLAPVIPQVIGERLRARMHAQSNLEIHDDLAGQRAAEAAYWSGDVAGFLAGQDSLDQVLIPVLLRTQNKLILNLEYYSVERTQAIDIDVASVELDAMTRAWLRAGPSRRRSPPGFRSLGSQVFSWKIKSLKASPEGRLIAVTPDSVHLLDFRYPGLRPSAQIALGAKELIRQESYTVVVQGHEIQAVLGERAAEIAERADVGDLVRETLRSQSNRHLTYVLSEERWPRAFATIRGASGFSSPQAVVLTRVGELFQEFWISMRGPTRFGSRWWPAPGWGRAIVQPVFGDLDKDGQTDLVWSNRDGALLVQRVASTRSESFQGFGDIKAMQPADDQDSNAVLWLTDPVWNGEPDRLHAAQLHEGKLRVFWSSDSFESSLSAIVSADLNADGAHDLVVAEELVNATRLHLFLALPGERTAARGGPLKDERGGQP